MNVRTAAVMALAAAFLAGCSDPEQTPVPTTTAPAIAIAAALLAVGCSDPEPTSVPTITATATTASPTTASTPTPPSPEEEATAAAEEVVRAYFETVPRCLADPLNTEPSCFDEVAIGSELNDSRNSLIAAKQVESTASGAVEVLSIERKSVDLAMDLDVSPPVVPVVIFDVCSDVSQFQIVDKDGDSLVPADRKPRVRADIGVYNYEYPSPDQWRVAFIEPNEDATC